jgi:hypothetical protein
MPSTIATPGRILLLCLSGLVTLWLLGLFTSQTMDSIPSQFTIKINGKPIAKVDDGADDHTQGKLGQDAAVFNLKDSQLQSGEWIIGRDWTENRSFGPKKVSWYKANADSEKQVQPVTAKKEADTYSLVFRMFFRIRL